MEILVVDLETTGFFAKNDAIVEVGISLVNTKTKEVTLVFNQVVKHNKFVKWKHKNSWIFQNSTLTVEDVENANPLSSYYKEIQALLDKYQMTAFNKAFDIRFLVENGFKVKDVKCLMHTAKQYTTAKTKTGRTKVPSVEEIYNQFFMTGDEVYIEEHRAGADAMDEGRILLHMVELKSKKLLVK